MDTTTLPPQVGEILEKGQQGAVNATKTVFSDVSNTVSDQVGLRNETNSAQVQNQSQNAPSAEPSSKVTQEDLEMTKEMVRDYYSPSQTKSNAEQAELEEQQRQAQLIQVRQKLALERHNEVYFDEVRNAGATKPQGQLSEQEEMEEVKSEDKMQDLQVQQKKDQDIARFRAERKVEIVGGPIG